MRQILLILLLFHLPLSAKIRLLSFHFNRPELVELQAILFKRFLLDEYELIVFNDADNPEDEELIRKECEKYNLTCIRYEQIWHRSDPLNDQFRAWIPISNGEAFLERYKEDLTQHPSLRHCHVIQFALDRFGYDHDDIVAIVDADLFPIRPTSIRNLLEGYQIIGIQAETGKDYFWVPFVAFDPKNVPDLNELRFGVSLIGDLIFDSGAQTYHYLQKHPDVKVKKFGRKNSAELGHLPITELPYFGFNPWEIKLIKSLPSKYNIEFHIDNRFIHLAYSTFHLPATKVKLKHIHTALKNDAKMGEEAAANLEKIYEYYSKLPEAECDFGQHLPTLKNLAQECPKVIEIGLGDSLVSTWGILQGLAENLCPEKSYLGIDIIRPHVTDLNIAKEESAKRNISFRFLKANDLEIDLEPCDLLFIDSLHTYCHLTYELETFSHYARKYIAMHDTSEPWGSAEDGAYAGGYSEYPASYNREKKGLWPAVEDFLNAHPEWRLEKRYLNCHGFTILKRVHD